MALVFLLSRHGCIPFQGDSGREPISKLHDSFARHGHEPTPAGASAALQSRFTIASMCSSCAIFTLLSFKNLPSPSRDRPRNSDPSIPFNGFDPHGGGLNLTRYQLRRCVCRENTISGCVSPPIFDAIPSALARRRWTCLCRSCTATSAASRHPAIRFSSRDGASPPSPALRKGGAHGGTKPRIDAPPTCHLPAG